MNEVTLLILRCAISAKESGFTALVVTLDTFLLSWHLHDLNTAYLPFIAGTGIQVGTSDPIFMQWMAGHPSTARPDEHPAFLLDLEAFRERLAAGDEQARDAFTLGILWLREANAGYFHLWADLAFLCQNWDRPIMLKGIQLVQDTHAAMDAHMDGIVMSNHGKLHPR